MSARAVIARALMMAMHRPDIAASLGLAAATPAALAAPQCSIASSGLLTFGTVVALASSGDQTTNSGSSFWINCNAEVTSAPQLYSSSARAMIGGGTLPFTLSLAVPGGIDLATASPGSPLAIARDGTNQTVTLYGKVRASDFKALPGGTYSSIITLTVEY